MESPRSTPSSTFLPRTQTWSTSPSLDSHRDRSRDPRNSTRPHFEQGLEEYPCHHRPKGNRNRGSINQRHTNEAILQVATWNVQGCASKEAKGGTRESQLDHVMTDYPRTRRVQGSTIDSEVLASDHALIISSLHRPPPPKVLLPPRAGRRPTRERAGPAERLATPATQHPYHHQREIPGSHRHLPHQL